MSPSTAIGVWKLSSKTTVFEEQIHEKLETTLYLDALTRDFLLEPFPSLSKTLYRSKRRYTKDVKTFFLNGTLFTKD